MSDITTLNCAGLACPGPVVETRKKLLARELPLHVIVDNEPAKENVRRLVEKMGFTPALTDNDDGTFTIFVSSEPEPETIISRRDAGDEQSTDTSERNTNPNVPGPSVVYIGSDEMGTGDSRLGKMLINGFLKTIRELTPLPSHIIFLNRGIYLALKDAKATIGPLNELQDMGIEILVCGTCLDFYNSKDDLAVGRISNMFEIGDTLNTACRVIKP